MDAILHIVSRAEWDQAVKVGAYRAASLETEGFIHCSKLEQVITVANNFYAGQHDLVLLVIDPDKLSAELRYEPPIGEDVDALFPHIYGPLNLEAVDRVVNFPSGDGGRFTLPDDLK